MQFAQADAHLDTANLQVSYTFADEDDRVIFRLKVGKRDPFYFNLAELTVEEIEAARSFVNDMFDEIQPTCAELDERAERENLTNDRPNPRTYRTVPRVERRKRKKQSNH